MSQQKPAKNGKEKKTAEGSGWISLTWDDLEHWAGSRSVSRGHSYQKQGRVQDLAISTEGRLLAFVQGGDRYVVAVELKKGKKIKADALESQCTCPVGYSGCKHAVAVVAAYLQTVADGQKIPIAATNDPRWKKLTAGDEDRDDYEEDFEDECEEDDFEDDDEIASNNSSGRKQTMHPTKKERQTKIDWDAKIRKYIREKSPDELADLLDSLVQRYPELREEFREQISLREGDVDRLVAQARKELQELTSEISWSNHWSEEGHIPDYSGLKHRLERLVSQGYCDAVLKLGRELLRKGMSQVEESHDEGETAMEIADCLAIVFEAVRKSTLPDPQKILYAIDACLEDDYDVVGGSVSKILDASWKSADWSAVADELAGRLKILSKSKDGGGSRDYHHDYHRDRLSDWLLTALENAGREKELSAVYESEARATGSYQRLVKYSIEQKRYDDAERWVREGIEKTPDKYVGTVSSLLASLCEVARARKQWDIVAAHAAWHFFDGPGIKTFAELVDRAKKAKCADRVRTAALRFLETGVSPLKRDAKQKDKCILRVDPAWPLPVPDYLEPMFVKEPPRYGASGPHYDVLLDMAIADKRPDDVLKWYDKMRQGEKQTSAGWGWQRSTCADRVAAAVAESHPERALEIYRKGLDAYLPQTGVPAYESVAAYLKKMQPIMDALGHGDEWPTLLAKIRIEYRNRPKFMEILDKLEGRNRTILETQKAQGRR